MVSDLWDHQREAVEAALEGIRTHGGYCLWAEMRTGKTRTAIETARRLGARRVLVVCPDKVRAVWAEQVERFWPGAPEVVMVEGPPARRGALLVREEIVAVVSFETGWRTPSIEAERWDLVVWDEAHKLKQASGKASRWAARVAERVPARLALSGTPTPHGPEDAWAVYRAVYPRDGRGPLGYRTLTEFRGRFRRPAELSEWRDKDLVFEQRGGNLLRFKWRDLDELHRRMYWHEDGVAAASRVLARDAVSMPEELDERLMVDLEPSARRLYHELETELVAKVGEGVVSAGNAMVLVLRLAQLTGGTLRSEDGATQRVSEAKEEATREYLEGAGGEPVVVFCRFHSDLDAVKRAGVEAGCGEPLELSGRVNQLREWQEGAGQVLAVQVQAGGVGISLVRSRLVLWYSLGYSFGDMTQARSRVLGPEQTRPVVFTSLVVRDSVDEMIWSALQAREDMVSSVVDGLRGSAQMSPSRWRITNAHTPSATIPRMV